MQYARDIYWQDPGAVLVDVVDRALILLYSHVRKNARRLTRLIVTLVPLMALLVGSCKPSQLPWSLGSNADPVQFRIALFPDRVAYEGVSYSPAAGYVSRAQEFVVHQPESMLMLTQQEITYLFGKPTLHRQDANAEVWQYKTAGCVVDFYFYDEAGTKGQSPLSYVDIRMKDEMVPGSAFRTRPLAPAEKSDCLHTVTSRGFFTTRV